MLVDLTEYANHNEQSLDFTSCDMCPPVTLDDCPYEIGRFSLKVDNVTWSFLSPVLPNKTEINNNNYQTTAISNY